MTKEQLAALKAQAAQRYPIQAKDMETVLNMLETAREEGRRQGLEQAAHIASLRHLDYSSGHSGVPICVATADDIAAAIIEGKSRND